MPPLKRFLLITVPIHVIWTGNDGIGLQEEEKHQQHLESINLTTCHLLTILLPNLLVYRHACVCPLLTPTDPCFDWTFIRPKLLNPMIFAKTC